MKLRLKVLMILVSMWLIISACIFIYSYSTLTNEYLRLEKKALVDNLQQTRKTFYTLFSSLKVLNTDWSQWNDLYQFMQNKNANFIKSNLAFTTFENAKINLILFFDNKGKLFYGVNYDLNDKKFIPIPSDLLTYLAKDKSFTVFNNIHDNKNGIFKTNAGYIVMSSRPILTSEGQGPIAGVLLMGYFLTNDDLIRISDILNLKVDFFPAPQVMKDSLLNLAYVNLNHGAKNFIAPLDKNHIYGFTILNDVEEKPIGMLRITMPRDLYNQGVSVIERYLAIVVSVGFIFILVIWYLLKFFVLDRLVSVSHKVVAISQESKFTQRLSVTGNDELDTLTVAINALLEIIELTQEQLKYRLFLRTEELERLSNLNKNLYSEMSNQKTIESKLRQDEKRFRKMAYYDTLTELPNRLFFMEMLQKMISKAEKDGSGLAILFIDADKLKSINDTYGHNYGDLFLKYSANQIKKSIKETDVAARLAGDEFIVCLANLKQKNLIAKVAEQLLQHLAEPLIINNLEITSTYSIGISIYPNDGTTVEDLEKNADLAMYYAKKLKGSAYYFYDNIKIASI